MTVLLIAHATFPQSWREAFEGKFQHEGLCLWPQIADVSSVDCAIVGRPEPGVLSRLPNLKLISSTGMGVDHILALPDLPTHVPVARVVTDEMVSQVAEYVFLAVLRVERDSDRFDRLQREGKWERRLVGRPGGRLRIGILGWGIIARACARHLSSWGFPVNAWARTSRSENSIVVHSGNDGLEHMLTRSDILISALPRTPYTDGILNAKSFNHLPTGAHVINVGRGEHIVEEDLLVALSSEKLSGATLDVFRQEPLPSNHPFWSHPKVRVTPHSAGLLSPEDAASTILRNLEHVRAGRPPENQVNLTAGF
jgi:glyoxylate/hydroxypyruvate reductase A